MTKKFSIPIHKAVVKMLMAESVEIIQYLDENYDKFQSQLEYFTHEYHANSGGSATVFELYIDNEDDKPEFNYQSLTGTFNVKYQIEYYFGCADLNTVEKYEMNWKISIDKTDLTVTFEGEDEWVMDN